MATIDLQLFRDAIAGVDAAVFRLINHGLGARWLDPIMLAINMLGVGMIQAGISAGMMLAGLIGRDGVLRRMGYAGFLAFAGSGLLSQLAKHLWDRPRPVLVMYDVRLASQPLFIHSFPSGHSTTAFAAAFAWAAFVPKWRWALYTLAALVGVSRVYLGAHFPFDVLFGGLLGSLIGTGAARFVRTKNDETAAAKPAQEGAE